MKTISTLFAAVALCGWTACGGNVRPATCLESSLMGGPAEGVRECYGPPDWRSVCDSAQTQTCLKPSQERWHYENSVAAGKDVPFVCAVMQDGKVETFLHDTWGCAMVEAGEISSTRAPNP